ncbi:MAG: hypothetical protein JNM88_04460 [Chitinophagaceae bacterium]|nr:hypothetical protein [Chitinophagaceae bacterium]
MAVCIPFLGVSNMGPTLEWYMHIGFTCTGTNWAWEPEAELNWAQLEWEGAAIMLFPSQKEMVPGHIRDAGLYFKVRSIAGLVDKLKQCARIIELTEETFYGKQEVTFEDLNGFRITMSAEGSQ